MINEVTNKAEKEAIGIPSNLTQNNTWLLGELLTEIGKRSVELLIVSYTILSPI